MVDVVAYIKTLPISTELKRAVYIFFRFESRNGEAGVNHNYAGIQADSGRWQAEYDKDIVGIAKKVDSGGNLRYFCAFKDFTVSVKFLAGRLQARGLYVGGTTHKIVKMQIASVTDFATAYEREWVTGNANAKPSSLKVSNFTSIYNAAKRHFI